MANHQSAKKRVRQDEKKRVHNKYYHKTARNAVRALRDTTVKTEGEGMLSRVCSLLDRLAKRNVIHKKKAANIKSSVTIHVNNL
ncbi:MAG: small subunit ribosomal protein S20 [Flavobacteriales bacterium]|jgi:small subunit ribosomal protein S20